MREAIEMVTQYTNLQKATEAMLSHDNSSVIGWKAEFQNDPYKNWWKVSKLVMVICDSDRWVEL